MTLFFAVIFFSLHPDRLERLLSTWPVAEVMLRLSVCCSRLELTLILWTKYVNVHNVMYVSCLQMNMLYSELNGSVHVQCTEGLVLKLCLSGNQCLIGLKAKSVFACYSLHTCLYFQQQPDMFLMQNDKSPLYWASFRCHTEIVVMLLKCGADLSNCRTVSTSYYITPTSTV